MNLININIIIKQFIISTLYYSNGHRSYFHNHLYKEGENLTLDGLKF